MTPSSEVTFTKNGFVIGIKRLLPISLFLVPFGIGFGVAALEKGFSAFEAIFMSAAVFSGAAQFAVLEIWHTSGILSIIIITLTVSIRMILYGTALAQWLNQLPFKYRFLCVFNLSDANFAEGFLSLNKKNERDLAFLFGGGFMLWFAWVIGTIIGVLLGNIIGDPSTYGLHVLMPCFFTALVMKNWDRKSIKIKVLAPFLLAIVITIATKGILTQGWNMIFAAIAAGGLAGLLHGK